MTGGTISEKTDPKTGASVISGSPADELVQSVPNITKIANLKIVEYSNIDSSQMTPEIWNGLSQTVDELLEDKSIVGAVVTHGTDTMAEGSYFLDLTLKSNKPVVFTGAMKNASDPYSDGPPNVINAMHQVLSKESNWGVTLTLNSYINSARDVVKINTINPQAFNSYDKGYLGYVFEDKIYKINDTLYHVKMPRPKKIHKVDIYVDYAGADGNAIRYLADNGSDAIIIESLGAGNTNKAVYENILYALKKDVLVVITTSVPSGGVFPIYGDIGGGEMLKAKGCILSNFLRANKARILMIVALDHYGKNKKILSKLFEKP